MEGREPDDRKELDRILSGGESALVKAQSEVARMREEMGLEVSPEASRTEDMIRMQSGDIHEGDILLTMGETSFPEGLMPEYELVTSAEDTAFIERMKRAKAAERGGTSS